MKEELRKNAGEETQVNLNQVASQARTECQFNTVEDVIRYDAATVVVPETIYRRLEKSISQEKSVQPFWKRWFKRL
ncbi:MAG: hypothetical protein ACP5MG_01795 [Verrucomicrobiia bacterium]